MAHMVYLAGGCPEAPTHASVLKAEMEPHRVLLSEGQPSPWRGKSPKPISLKLTNLSKQIRKP